MIYDDAVRDAAQHRVDHALERLREAGIEATGEVMDPDPYHAMADAVREFDVDEIIISTHPETRSGWLRRDLVERVEDATGLPVEHVVVDLDADRERRHPHARGRQPDRRPASRCSACSSGKAAEKPHRFIVIVPQDGGRRAPRRRGARAPGGDARAAARRGPRRHRRDRRPRSVHRRDERAPVLPRRTRSSSRPFPWTRSGWLRGRPDRARPRRHRRSPSSTSSSTPRRAGAAGRRLTRPVSR